MRRKKVEVIRLDENNHVYLYPKKVVYKKKKNGKWIVKFTGLTLSGLLESDVIDSSVKEKLKKMLESKNSFFNRG
jgi:hypothetical protein